MCCSFHPEISSFFLYEFPFFIPMFVLYVLQYFSFPRDNINKNVPKYEYHENRNNNDDLLTET